MSTLTITRRQTPEDALRSMAMLSTVTVPEAKALWADHRVSQGLAHTSPPILSAPKGNAKLAKSMAYGLSLAPARSSGIVNVCPASTVECRRFCVSKAGRGAMNYVQKGREVRTSFLMAEPTAFMVLIVDELSKAARKAHLQDVTLHVRMNTFSDIAWEQAVPWLFSAFRDVQFYDYTKRWDRIEGAPENYALAASIDENTSLVDIYAHNGPMAIVLDVRKRSQDLPATWRGMPVVDADKSDRWVVEQQGRRVLGGLRPKGKLAKSDSPFIRK